MRRKEEMRKAVVLVLALCFYFCGVTVLNLFTKGKSPRLSEALFAQEGEAAG